MTPRPKEHFEERSSGLVVVRYEMTPEQKQQRRIDNKKMKEIRQRRGKKKHGQRTKKSHGAVQPWAGEAKSKRKAKRQAA